MSNDLDSQPGVLLVDDEQYILDGYRTVLRKEPYQLHTAISPEAGRQVLANEKIDVVVSDFNMPDEDGAAFLQTVRRDHPDVMRIMLTGEIQLNVAMKAINTGEVYRFLTKPCKPADMAMTLRNAIEQKRLVQQNAFLLSRVEELRTLVSQTQTSLGEDHPALAPLVETLADTYRTMSAQMLSKANAFERRLAKLRPDAQATRSSR